MRLGKLFAALSFGLLVAACATDVNTRQALEPTSVGELQFDEIEVTSTLASFTQDDADRLKMSVLERLAELPQGNTPVKIQIAVTQFEIQSGAARFFAGALIGANRMNASVAVLDEIGTTLADFEVLRSANPGGYGAFYSQTNATIDAVADGIVEVLSGESGANRDL